MMDPLKLRPGNPNFNLASIDPNGVTTTPLPVGVIKHYEPAKPTLAEMGVDKNLAKRARKLASISDRAIEGRIAGWRKKAQHDAGRVTINLLRDGDKRERRDARERELAEAINADNLTLPNKRYGVILADPEWKFEFWSEAGKNNSSADNHYPTTPLDEIKRRDVPSISADNCILFLWATVPMLPAGLSVMAAWGFESKSHCIWRKDGVGTGYWFRNAHEILLVGTRGKIPAPAPGSQWTSMIDASVRMHSEKPDWQYELIESYFPHLLKIELNARGRRPGWDAWGADVPPLERETGEIETALPPPFRQASQTGRRRRAGHSGLLVAWPPRLRLWRWSAVSTQGKCSVPDASGPTAGTTKEMMTTEVHQTAIIQVPKDKALHRLRGGGHPHVGSSTSTSMTVRPSWEPILGDKSMSRPSLFRSGAWPRRMSPNGGLILARYDALPPGLIPRNCPGWGGSVGCGELTR
jgi:N6-adenosine-specific RNA methylase IME4